MARFRGHKLGSEVGPGFGVKDFGSQTFRHGGFERGVP